jgi:hypothetical protein
MIVKDSPTLVEISVTITEQPVSAVTHTSEMARLVRHARG